MTASEPPRMSALTRQVHTRRWTPTVDGRKRCELKLSLRAKALGGLRKLRTGGRRGRHKSFHSNQLLASAAPKSLSSKVFCSVSRVRAAAHSRNA
ncbi:hypothetical protein XbrCFBP1976_13545 [Xanthomonas bromi]|uniref:Uncharacterized protein n=1 Tax=Xanthomonas bromi TaxID=56449 RepID=A0ABX5BP34_9XANT|nr:hypothetical protein XbrCFBP1976_13545 [Xanthomonas bromi]